MRVQFILVGWVRSQQLRGQRDLPQESLYLGI